MAYVIQPALGIFMCSLGEIGRTKSWESHERSQEFGENKSIDIGRCQILWHEGNAWMNNVAAMKPGLARVIEKVCISRYIEGPDTDLYIGVNAW